MKFFYKFSNILGSVYHKGDLAFFQDGFTFLSPVGNRIVFHELRNNQSKSLPVEVDFNFEHLSLSPNGRLLLASTENIHIYLISIITGSILYHKDFKHSSRSINCLSFSPNGVYYAVCADNAALIYLTPGLAFTNQGRELAPFKIYKVIKTFYDETTCVGWSQDSELIAIGSKDLTVKVLSLKQNADNQQFYINLASHSSALVSCFFTSITLTDLNLCSLSKNGQLFVWQPSVEKDEKNEKPLLRMLSYCKYSTHYLNDFMKITTTNFVTAADYNSKAKLLVTGFSNGAFILLELPEFNLIHCLEMEKLGHIDSLKINPTGEWIAIASGVRSLTYADLEFETEKTSQSQLIVWDWQSESFVYNQTGTGIGYTHLTECIAYSADGSTLASGESNGNVKIWNTFTGHCIVNFSEHKAAVTGVNYQPSSGGKVIISASLDGTIRAFDFYRFKNFRTLTTPPETITPQFISLAIDTLSSDFIAAGAQNLFEIFLWSLKTGKFLESLTGHQAPVSGIEFSPNNNILVSCSWDQTVRIWSLFEGPKCTREIIHLGTDATNLAFRPDGNQFSVSTINGNISLFNPNTGEMNGVAIEGHKDLGFSQKSYELSRVKDTFFTTICYSSDGLYIIAGGKSKYICIYHASEKILIKKFAFTCNQSLEGVFDFISDRKKAEFGFNQDLINFKKDSNYKVIKLPGVKSGDFGDRSARAVIAINSVKFSPTMRCFAAATTEGILIYSLDCVSIFNPFELEPNINPNSIELNLESKQYSNALMQALKLNDNQLLSKVIESVPKENVKFLIETLSISYVQKCLEFISISLEKTRHLEFYIIWIQVILNKFGVTMKTNYSASSELMSILRLLQRNLSKKCELLNKICDFNQYRLKFIQIISDMEQEMLTD